MTRVVPQHQYPPPDYDEDEENEHGHIHEHQSRGMNGAVPPPRREDMTGQMDLPEESTPPEEDEGPSTPPEELEDDDESVGTSGDELDDKAFQELLERELIVEKYERGPDGQEVDPWENPDFELYKVTDRYGFVHKSESDVEMDKRQKERDRIKKEIRREAKWLRMLDEWKQRHPAKLPERIWKGVPEKLRASVWLRMLGAEDLKKAAKPNLYRELLMRARLVSSDIRQIDLDINRTYRDHLAFRQRYDVKQQSLFSVLAAYAVYNTEIGYCQGMSQIAGLFLMYMDEEDAFWCMHSLMVSRRYTMHGMFAPGFPKLHRFQEHYEKVLIKYLPKLKKHFDREGVIPSYLTKWWFGCFLDRVPFPLCLRVWDVFLYYGDSILIAMAYNIMDLHQKTLKKLSMERCLDFIQSELAKDFGYTFDYTMESLEKCLKRLQSDRMALPHPPAPGGMPEVPTKPLGPILTRSMVDIRMDIAEIHSRGSRANSLHGRSPAPRRRRNPPSPSPMNHRRTAAMNAANANANANAIAAAAGGPRAPATATQSLALGGSGTVNGSSPSPPPGRLSPGSDDRVSGNTVPASNSNLSNIQPPAPAPEPPATYRKPMHPLKPIMPDQDGFVPMSPRRKEVPPAVGNRASVYDNVPQSSSGDANVNVFGYGNHLRTASNRSSSNNDSVRHSRESSADRVRRMPNNVTYVEVGGDEGDCPHIPPPDYEGAPGMETFTMRSEKLSRTTSAYQHRRGQAPPNVQPKYSAHARPFNNSSMKQYGGGVGGGGSGGNEHRERERERHQPQMGTSGGRYYFEADPPEIVRRMNNGSPGAQQQGPPRHKHSYV